MFNLFRIYIIIHSFAGFNFAKSTIAFVLGSLQIKYRIFYLPLEFIYLLQFEKLILLQLKHRLFTFGIYLPIILCKN